MAIVKPGIWKASVDALMRTYDKSKQSDRCLEAIEAIRFILRWAAGWNFIFG